MNTELLLVPGGIGIFLLGMTLLTDGLRGMAGGSLRRMLARFTKTPLSGAGVGALTTAIVQSSSATTVAAVGFVAAGLLSFPQALGIVFGANVGTTLTGWLVAILGFKLSLGQIVLPLVLVGVLLRIFATGRLRHIGLALAGFSLLFIGISAMQDGMASFKGVVTPASFPDDTLTGRLLLVLLGIVITVVTQSSSAGVAAALVALDAGAISFAQGAAMVIGMDVGTTFTAALATVGGSTAARQTGFAHVIYNVLTGVMAFAMLVPVTVLADAFIKSGTGGDAQIALVAFHTFFNAIGVLLVVPFARPFAALIVRLVPERGPQLTSRLDERLLSDPASAIEASVATIADISRLQLQIIADLTAFPGVERDIQTRMATVDDALRLAGQYVEQIRTQPDQAAAYARHLAVVHALDHMIRLSHRCTQTDRITELKSEHRLRRLSAILQGSTLAYIKEHDLEGAEARFDRLRTLLRDQRRLYRHRMVTQTARQKIDAETLLRRLDSVRWLHRTSYHVWRILHHRRIAQDDAITLPSPSDEEAMLEVELD